MPRLLSLALLFAAVPALAQTTVVVTATPEGLRLDAPADTPTGDAPAALLTHVPDGQWHLRVLSRGEVPARGASPGIAALVVPPRPPAPPARPAFGSSRPTDDAGLVTYRVRGHVAADGLDALLVRLSEADGLRLLESTSGEDGAAVEAVFAFGSAAAWAAWHARPETGALLAPLADAETALRVHR